MFKELLATALLSTCVSTGALRDLPKQQLFSNEINGSYCFTERVDYYLDGYTNVTFSYTQSGDSYIYCYDYSRGTKGDWSILGGFTFSYIDGGYWSLTFVLTDFEDTVTELVTSSYDFDEQPMFLKQIVLWCNGSLYFNGDDLNVFNFLFSHQPNTSVDIYTGWYTYNYVLSDDYTYQLYGYITGGNNMLYNHLTCTTYSNYSDIELNLVGGTGDQVYPMHNANGWNGSQRLYFNAVLIPSTLYSAFNHDGQFSFVPSQPQYDLTNYLFGVLDAPIYIFYSLFNFDLLGVNLFIAICSLITLACAMFILRIIIKFS